MKDRNKYKKTNKDTYLQVLEKERLKKKKKNKKIMVLK